MSLSVLLPGGAGVTPAADDALAEADGCVPLFWLFLFDEAASDDDGVRLTTPKVDGIQRGRDRLAMLAAQNPGVLDDLIPVWLSFLDDLDADELVVRLALGDLDADPRRLVRHLPAVGDPTSRDFARLLALCGWPDGLPTTGADPDGTLAARLCGVPRYRAVPWPVPVVPTRGPEVRPVAVAPRELGRDRRWALPAPRPERPASSDPTLPVRRHARLGPVWLMVNGPVIALLLAGTLDWTSSGARPAPNDGVLAIALVCVVAVAGLVRPLWPVTTLTVMSTAVGLLALLGYAVSPVTALVFAGVATVAYRRSWPWALMGAAEATLAVTLAISREATGEAIGLIPIWMLVIAGLGAATKWVRALPTTEESPFTWITGPE